ncbi:MAG: signal recognition particle protein [Deltaproteobacteria bacterium]|nr:signal recognition particle protein [Deltaproteobacteria bacterium]
MLETLTDGFKRARERLAGTRTLDESNVKDALAEGRASLLEADVDFAVVKDFLARVKERALGDKVETRVKDASGQLHQVTPGQHFVKVCEDELVALMGPVDPELSRDADGVTSIMLLGLQGVGKTTIAAKLARHLAKDGRRPLLVAADIARPAAVLQLQQLGASIEVPVHAGAEGEQPASICAAARARAAAEGFDAIVYDTAGRLAIDDDLMTELEAIGGATRPANSLLVCDALMGRDAVNVAQAFAERLDLDGLVLTKLDGDSRGGAALAVKSVTGVPIKFIGTGETVDRLEAFRPEGLASRILGMGDIVGLVQDFEEVVDTQQAEEDAERMLKGQFGMDDLLAQLKTIQKMGPLKDVMAKMPMFGELAEQVDERELVKVESMIQSMTVLERKKPDVIDKSRARRIAGGSGRAPKDVTELVGRFSQMREMMASLGGGGGLLSKIPGLNRLAGAGIPGDMDPAALMGGVPGGGNRKMRRRQAAGASNKAKKKRKAARKSRRKGRKK